MKDWEDMTEEEIFNDLHDDEYRRQKIDDAEMDIVYTDEEVIEGKYIW